jgi:hypothetical protein
MSYAPYIEQCDVSILAPNEKKPYFYHDCRENVLRNLFNNILYDPADNRFNPSLLHSIREIASKNGNTVLIDRIIEFYSIYDSPIKQGLKDENILIEAAAKWCDLVAGLRGVTYWWPTGRVRRPFTMGDTHEINAGIGNYLRVFAHIFGMIGEGQFCPVLDFESLESLFQKAGVKIKFVPNNNIPLPEADLNLPATLRDVKHDNHDVEVTVKLTKGNEELKFLWYFVIGHMEVYFVGGPHDHPLPFPSWR